MCRYVCVVRIALRQKTIGFRAVRFIPQKQALLKMKPLFPGNLPLVETIRYNALF